MVRWSDLRDGVDIHEVLYTGPLVYLCVCSCRAKELGEG